MKNEKIIRPYYDKDKKLRIGVFENKDSKTPITSTTKHINKEDLEEILRSIEVSEYKKPKDQRATVSYKLQRNNNFIKYTSLGLSMLLVISLVGYGVASCTTNIFKKSKKDNKRIENSIEEDSLLALTTPNINYEVEENKDNLVSLVEDKLNEYTNAEKLEFVKKNIENFKNDIQTTAGIVLTDDEALIQLGFINGLTLKDINVNSSDYFFDFVSDYETILQEITIPSVNYLSFNHKLKGQNSSNGKSIYAKYIMNDKDRIVYSYYADRTQSIIYNSYCKDKETVLKESTDFVRSIAETVVYPNNPIQKDNVKKYLETRKELINELNKVPSYEELANKLNITINEVRELEVASLGVTSVSNQTYFMLLDVTQIAVQLLPKDTIIEYTNTIGEIDNSIMNYNSEKGAPKDTNPENYEHDKYLMLDIEYFAENTIVKLISEEQNELDTQFENTENNVNCDTENYSSNKTYIKKIK